MLTYLGALSCINAILIPRISAHPPILAQCKVHRPWALFREGTVYVERIHDSVCLSLSLYLSSPLPICFLVFMHGLHVHVCVHLNTRLFTLTPLIYRKLKCCVTSTMSSCGRERPGATRSKLRLVLAIRSTFCSCAHLAIPEGMLI